MSKKQKKAKKATDSNSIPKQKKAKKATDSNSIPKKKRYERQVKVKAAGVVANFLVYNAKDFKGRYEGSGVYAFRVADDDKEFLDNLIDQLEE